VEFGIRCQGNQPDDFQRLQGQRAHTQILQAVALAPDPIAQRREADLLEYILPPLARVVRSLELQVFPNLLRRDADILAIAQPALLEAVALAPDPIAQLEAVAYRQVRHQRMGQNTPNLEEPVQNPDDFRGMALQMEPDKKQARGTAARPLQGRVAAALGMPQANAFAVAFALSHLDCISPGVCRC
jgi:hypothetical protein